MLSTKPSSHSAVALFALVFSLILLITRSSSSGSSLLEGGRKDEAMIVASPVLPINLTVPFDHRPIVHIMTIEEDREHLAEAEKFTNGSSWMDRLFGRGSATAAESQAAEKSVDWLTEELLASAEATAQEKKSVSEKLRKFFRTAREKSIEVKNYPFDVWSKVKDSRRNTIRVSLGIGEGWSPYLDKLILRKLKATKDLNRTQFWFGLGVSFGFYNHIAMNSLGQPERHLILVIRGDYERLNRVFTYVAGLNSSVEFARDRPLRDLDKDNPLKKTATLAEGQVFTIEGLEGTRIVTPAGSMTNRPTGSSFAIGVSTTAIAVLAGAPYLIAASLGLNSKAAYEVNFKERTLEIAIPGSVASKRILAEAIAHIVKALNSGSGESIVITSEPRSISKFANLRCHLIHR